METALRRTVFCIFVSNLHTFGWTFCMEAYYHWQPLPTLKNIRCAHLLGWSFDWKVQSLLEIGRSWAWSSSSFWRCEDYECATTTKVRAWRVRVSEVEESDSQWVDGGRVRWWGEMRGRRSEPGECSTEVKSEPVPPFRLHPLLPPRQRAGCGEGSKQGLPAAPWAWSPPGRPTIIFAMCLAAAWPASRRSGRRGMKTFQASRICWRSTRGLTTLCEPEWQRGIAATFTPLLNSFLLHILISCHSPFSTGSGPQTGANANPQNLNKSTLSWHHMDHTRTLFWCLSFQSVWPII